MGICLRADVTCHTERAFVLRCDMRSRDARGETRSDRRDLRTKRKPQRAKHLRLPGRLSSDLRRLKTEALQTLYQKFFLRRSLVAQKTCRLECRNAK